MPNGIKDIKEGVKQVGKGIKKSFTEFIRNYKTGEIPYTTPSWIKSYVQGKVPLTVPKSIMNDPKARANLTKYMKTLKPKGPSGGKGYAHGGGVRKARYK